MMKNILVLLSITWLAAMGVCTIFALPGQNITNSFGMMLLIAEEEEEELQLDIKEEEAEGPDRVWNVQFG